MALAKRREVARIAREQAKLNHELYDIIVDGKRGPEKTLLEESFKHQTEALSHILRALNRPGTS